MSEIKVGDEVYLKSWNYCIVKFNEDYHLNGISSNKPSMYGIYERSWRRVYEENPHVVNRVFDGSLRINFSSLVWRIEFFSLDSNDVIVGDDFFKDLEFEL